ncbi:MAG: hypothetical protein HC866_06680 [Leptolyngbyaceae cyanobacterium RU_5_1]|nr:hypothetical protein [Leptolyngbyaceae cyanobacterium RU_5_1]
MSNDLRWIAPTPPEPNFEVLEAHQLTREFYEEIQHRQAFEQYCQWYDSTVARHRQELKKMQNDFNLLGWFRRSPQR